MSSLPAEIPADLGAAMARLGSVDKMSADDMKLMVLLEMSGEPLYEGLAALVDDAEAKELLLANGREETAHAHRLKKAIEIVTGEPYALPTMAENPFAEPPAFPAVSPELLQGVVAGENSGDAMYQTFADKESNPEVAELLRQNGREEGRHGERVARVIEIIS